MQILTNTNSRHVPMCIKDIALFDVPTLLRELIDVDLTISFTCRLRTDLTVLHSSWINIFALYNDFRFVISSTYKISKKEEIS